MIGSRSKPLSQNQPPRLFRPGELHCAADFLRPGKLLSCRSTAQGQRGKGAAFFDSATELSIGSRSLHRHLGNGSAAGALLQVPEVAGAHVLLAGDFVIGAGQESDGGVARAVGEPAALDPRAAGGADVLADDGMNHTVVGVDRIDPLLQQQRDLRLGADDGQLPAIGVHFRTFGVAVAPFSATSSLTTSPTCG